MLVAGGFALLIVRWQAKSKSALAGELERRSSMSFFFDFFFDRFHTGNSVHGVPAPLNDADEDV